MVGSHDEKIAMLVSMGFNKERSVKALNSSGNGCLETAVTKLLSGSDEGGGSTGEVENDSARMYENQESSTSSTTSSTNIVQCEISQYTIPNGRSACTCISLVAARDFLSMVDTVSSTENVRNILTTEFLQNSIVSGVSIYNEANNNNNSMMEHMSAEEVLRNCPSFFSSLVLRGGIRQGILSSSSSNNIGAENDLLGIKAQLQACRNQNEDYVKSKWMAVVISKTPETICTLLPPLSQRGPFILIDSHPRHQQFQIDGSYVKLHSTIDDLVRSLQRIFPYTSLGYDVSETMAMMYNSFDLYALQSN